MTHLVRHFSPVAAAAAVVAALLVTLVLGDFVSAMASLQVRALAGSETVMPQLVSLLAVATLIGAAVLLGYRLVRPWREN